jgi:hypothetical protein
MLRARQEKRKRQRLHLHQPSIRPRVSLSSPLLPLMHCLRTLHPSDLSRAGGCLVPPLMPQNTTCAVRSPSTSPPRQVPLARAHENTAFFILRQRHASARTILRKAPGRSPCFVTTIFAQRMLMARQLSPPALLAKSIRHRHRPHFFPQKAPSKLRARSLKQRTPCPRVAVAAATRFARQPCQRQASGYRNIASLRKITSPRCSWQP